MQKVFKPATRPRCLEASQTPTHLWPEPKRIYGQSWPTDMWVRATAMSGFCTDRPRLGSYLRLALWYPVREVRLLREADPRTGTPTAALFAQQPSLRSAVNDSIEPEVTDAARQLNVGLSNKRKKMGQDQTR